MRSPVRFKLLLDYGEHLSALFRALDRPTQRQRVGYVIDLHEHAGLMWATALHVRFARPDVDACREVANGSVPRGRAIVTGCELASDMAQLAAAMTAGMQRRGLPDALLAEFIEVELRLGRAPPVGAFRVLVVGDDGAEVADERFELPAGSA